MYVSTYIHKFTHTPESIRPVSHQIQQCSNSSEGYCELYSLFCMPFHLSICVSVCPSRSLDVWKEFQEEAYSVALHPSGLFVLVGFSEKLRLLNILIDDIRVFKEISIRGCRECRFSTGGHLFAAANSNLIQVYGTYTFENVGNLKGHSGKVCVGGELPLYTVLFTFCLCFCFP